MTASTSRFECAGALTYDVAASSTFILSLHVRESAAQVISGESLTTSHSGLQLDPPAKVGGNRFTRIVVDTLGHLSIEYRATVEVTYEQIPLGELPHSSPATIPPKAFNYLFPSRYCPSDILRDAAFQLFGHLPTQYEQALAIEDWIHQNVTYTIGSSGEHTTASHTFESGEGVCRDFAHLGITLCRALAIPARYLTVYAHDLTPPDFHACFEAHIGGRWLLFDGTRLAPLNALVRIAIARDAATAPVATIYGDPGPSTVSASCNALGSFSEITRAHLNSSGFAIALG